MVKLWSRYSLNPGVLKPWCSVQGYLAHKKTPTPLGPPWGSRHHPTVGSQGWVQRPGPGTGDAACKVMVTGHSRLQDTAFLK